MKNLKTISFLAYVHVLAFALRCHALEVNFELTSFPCTYNTLFPCANTIWDVNRVKTTCRWLWSYSGVLWRDINLREITDVTDKLLTEVGPRETLWSFKSIIIWEPLLLFPEKNETVNNSHVNQMKKQCFPPSNQQKQEVDCQDLGHYN